MGVSGGIAAAVIAAAAAENSSEQSRRTAHGQMDQQRQIASDAIKNRPQDSMTSDNASLRRKIMSSALTGSAAGNASTFLTGSSGIDDRSLNLGKSALLGQ